jgi:cysteine-rich repeat protein
MRVVALALLFVGCTSDPVTTYLDAEQFECVEDACPLEPGDVDPCDAFNRPMVCVDAATVALSGIDVDGETVGCDAVCVATCDDDCDDGSQCRDVGIERLCVPEDCGNGYLDPDEACDDGNGDDGDDCTTACELPTCGDGLLQGDEECDDGSANGDDQACTDDCAIARCGDGLVGPNEACDDANDDQNDDCLTDCTVPDCGDGVLADGEACDDGNLVDDDGCSIACDVEVGFDCSISGCECSEGYTGDACDECSPNYQDEDGDGTCLADCGLASLSAPCDADTEACAIVDGEASCECADGFEDSDAGCVEIPACRRYVSEGASGTGATWADPSGNIQAMVDAVAVLMTADATLQCEVWVGEGTWTVGDILRTETIQLADNVVIRGGFAGTEEELEERDLAANGRPTLVSILDGQENAYHVITAANTNTVDGFVITGGMADQTAIVSDHGWGAGIYARDTTNLTVMGTLFTANDAQRGAGIATNGNLDIIDSAFESNTATYAGAGINAEDGGTVHVMGGSFVANTTSDGHGAAILALDIDALFISDSSFMDNVTEWDGGAISAIGVGQLIINGSNFITNGSLDLGCLGGAIYAEDADLELGDVLFLGNSSMMEGGALYLNGVDVTIDNAMFRDNVSYFEGAFGIDPGGRGGAIVGYELGGMSIANSTFDGNSAYWDGGAIYISESPTLTLSNTNFSDNTSDNGASGGIYALDVDAVDFAQTDFTGNASHFHGTSLWAQGFTSVTVDGADVRENFSQSGHSAGFLLASDDAASVSLSHATFTDNSASVGAEALFIAGVGRVTLDSVDVDGNGGANGGAVSIYEVGDVDISNAAFTNNDGSWVGALFVRGFDTLDVTDSAFSANEAGFGSGLAACGSNLDADVDDAYTSCGSLDFSEFVSETSHELAVSLTNVSFDANVAGSGKYGAAAALIDLRSVVLDTVVVTNHNGDPDVEGDGSSGAIFVEGVAGTVTVDNSTFDTNDSAGWIASALNVRWADELIITDCEFRNGESYSFVGVEHTPSVVVEDSLFEDNSGGGGSQGMGVRSNHGMAMDIARSTFQRMDAGNGGGALWLEGSGANAHFSAVDSIFSELTAEVMGGAMDIRMDDGSTDSGEDDPMTNGTIVVSGSTFSDLEVGTLGGAIVADGYLDVNISDSTFTDTSAGVIGGAVTLRAYSHDANVTLSDVAFEQTSAGTIGGAFEAQNVYDLTLADVRFTDTTAGTNGGAMWASVAESAVVSDVTIERASAEITGGAMVLSGSSSTGGDRIAQIDRLRIVDSTTGTAGAGLIVEQYGLIEINDSHFEGNSTGSIAGVAAGAYLYNVTDATVNRTAFIDNTAGGTDEEAVGYTGALTAERVLHLAVNDSLFAGNLVENASGVSRGGGIHFVPDEVSGPRASFSVVGSTFEGNTASDGGSAIAIWRWNSSMSTTDMEVTNSIVIDNAGLNAIEHTNGNFEGDLGLSNSAIQDLDILGTNVFSDDPLLFGGAATLTDAYRPWRMMPGSLALGAGTTNAASVTDLDGVTRNDPPDLGALEAP